MVRVFKKGLIASIKEERAIAKTLDVLVLQILLNLIQSLERAIQTLPAEERKIL